MAAILLASTALIAGCGKKKVEAIAAGRRRHRLWRQRPTDPNAGAGQIVPGSQEDFLASVGQVGDRILFDTDRFNVDAEDQVTLQAQAQWLARYPNTRVTSKAMPTNAARANTTLHSASAAPIRRKIIWLR